MVVPSPFPRIIEPQTNFLVKSIASSYKSACAIDLNDQLLCWGDGTSALLGQTQRDSYSYPQLVDLGPGRTAKQVSMSQIHACVLLDNNSLRCWGNNFAGQLGNGSMLNDFVLTHQTVTFSGGRYPVSIDTGYGTTCAILNDQTLWCWGWNNNWQLGIGNNTDQSTPQQVDLGPGRTALKVAIAQHHTCAIADDYSLQCWGTNLFGQLGSGNTFHSTTPQLVNLGIGRSATDVATGLQHSCAILDDGSVKCWGYNGSGQLGTGDSTDYLVPQLVNIGAGVTAQKLFVGDYATCVIMTDGSAKCWADYNAPLINSLNIYSIPHTLDLSPGSTAQTLGLGINAGCAVLGDSRVKCWGETGYKAYGMLNDGPELKGAGALLSNYGMASVGQSQGRVRELITMNAQDVILDLSATVAPDLENLDFYIVAGGAGYTCNESTAPSWWTKLNSWSATSNYIRFPNAQFTDSQTYGICVEVRPTQGSGSRQFYSPNKTITVYSQFDCQIGTFDQSSGQCTCTTDPNGKIAGGGYRAPCYCTEHSAWDGTACAPNSTFDCGSGIGTNDGFGNCTCPTDGNGYMQGGGFEGSCSCSSGTWNGSVCDVSGSFDCGIGSNDGNDFCTCPADPYMVGGGSLVACSCSAGSWSGSACE